MNLQMWAATRWKFFSERNLQFINIIGDTFTNLADFSHLLAVLREKDESITRFFKFVNSFPRFQGSLSILVRYASQTKNRYLKSKKQRKNLKTSIGTYFSPDRFIHAKKDTQNSGATFPLRLINKSIQVYKWDKDNLQFG